MSGAQTEGSFHETLKPLSWLFGRWRSHGGKGIYPTMADFKYAEVAEFYPVAMKPVIEYKLRSWKADDDTTQFHRETGFIKIKPDSNQVAFVAVHHIGVMEIQVGEVKGQELTVETTNIQHHPFFSGIPQVRKIRRTLKRRGDEMEQVMYMETEKTGLTEHLRITWKKDKETPSRL